MNYRTNEIIREIASKIQSAPYFTVMIDEATDLSNIEQVVMVIHSVDNNLTDFITLSLLNQIHLFELSKMFCFV